ncbi:MAG: DedA family protein [Oscillospiraceae bacterium]
MQDIIINIIGKFGYIGITLLIAIENIFPPIPSEVILAFGGFATSFTKLNVVGVIIAATIGSLLGAIALYYIGSILNKERLGKLVNGKIGRILRLKMSDIEKAETWFDKRGNITVLFCRCIPIVRSLISIPAGMAKMNFLTFILLTTIGSTAWNTLLTLLGAAAGNSWTQIVAYFDEYSKITLVVLFVIFIIGGFIFYKKRGKNSASEEEAQEDNLEEKEDNDG